jgi:hypothetical protein
MPEDEKKWREIERGFDNRIAIKRWGPMGPDDITEPARAATPSATRRPQQRRSWFGSRRAG